MIDAGEDVNTAVKREFMEEVLDSDGMSPEEVSTVDEALTRMFGDEQVQKTVIYQGYVDDRRNTDNSWMETTCVHIKCSTELEDFLRPQNLKAGSDAAGVAWISIESGQKLPVHAMLVQKFVDNLLQECP